MTHLTTLPVQLLLEIVVGWFILKYTTVTLQHVELDCTERGVEERAM